MSFTSFIFSFFFLEKKRPRGLATRHSNTYPNDGRLKGQESTERIIHHVHLLPCRLLTKNARDQLLNIHTYVDVLLARFPQYVLQIVKQCKTKKTLLFHNMKF